MFTSQTIDLTIKTLDVGIRVLQTEYEVRTLKHSSLVQYCFASLGLSHLDHLKSWTLPYLVSPSGNHEGYSQIEITMMHPSWCTHGVERLTSIFKINCLIHHSIIPPCGLVPWSWNMSIILCGSLNKKLRTFFYYSYIQLNLEIWVGLYYWHYKQESLFIMSLFLGNIVHRNTIIEKYRHYSQYSYRSLCVTVHYSNRHQKNSIF